MTFNASKLKTYILPCVVILGSSLSYSQVLAQDSRSGSSLDSCRSLSDPSLRLECYDRILGAAPATPTQPSPAPSLPTPPTPSPMEQIIPEPVAPVPAPSKIVNPLEQSVEDFKDTKAAKRSKEKVKSVSSEIVRADTFGYKRLRVYLKNGQVWEQTDSTRLTPPKISKTRKPFAKITKASMGSYFLRINGKSRAIKVRRIR